MRKHRTSVTTRSLVRIQSPEPDHAPTEEVDQVPRPGLFYFLKILLISLAGSNPVSLKRRYVMGRSEPSRRASSLRLPLLFGFRSELSLLREQAGGMVTWFLDNLLCT